MPLTLALTLYDRLGATMRNLGRRTRVSFRSLALRLFLLAVIAGAQRKVISARSPYSLQPVPAGLLMFAGLLSRARPRPRRDAVSRVPAKSAPPQAAPKKNRAPPFG